MFSIWIFWQPFIISILFAKLTKFIFHHIYLNIITSETNCKLWSINYLKSNKLELLQAKPTNIQTQVHVFCRCAKFWQFSIGERCIQNLLLKYNAMMIYTSHIPHAFSAFLLIITLYSVAWLITRIIPSWAMLETSNQYKSLGTMLTGSSLVWAVSLI